MGLFDGLLELRDPDVGSLKVPGRWLQNWFGGAPTKAGIRVDENNALKLWAVFACVNILSRTVGQLPCITYQRRPRGRERASRHPVYQLLKVRPNPEMSANSFFRTLTAHKETWGNAYARIEFLGSRPVALWPITPHRVTPERTASTRTLRYRVSNPKGGPDTLLAPEEVLHIAGLGYDGVVGYSRVEMARELLGKSFALEEFTSLFFSQGTNAGMIIKHPEELGTDGRESLEKSLATEYAGLGKSHKVLLLDEGMTAERTGITNEQAQFNQTQILIIRQVCGYWSIPTYMLGLEDKEPRASTEAKGLDFLTYTMAPELINWEQEINYKLYTPPEREEFFSEFLADAILRTTMQERMAAYKDARYAGLMDGHEIRERENLPAQDDSTLALWQPVNMMTAGDKAAANQPLPSSSRSLPPQGGAGAVERRGASGGVRARRVIRRRFRPLIQERMQELVRREVADVKGAARKYIGERDAADFRAWLAKYYSALPDKYAAKLRQVFDAIAEAIGDASATEVNEEWTDDLKDKVRQFVDGYISSRAERWSAESMAQLEAALDKAKVDELNPYDSVVDQLDDWEDSRAEKKARREHVQLPEAVQQVVWVAAGWTGVIWRTHGGENCPYCDALNGKRMRFGGAFVDMGESFHPSGAARPFSPSTTVRHCPLHSECDCSTEPYHQAPAHQ